MINDIFVTFYEANSEMGITFLVDCKRFKKDKISNLTISGDSFIMCNLVHGDKNLDTDNSHFIFNALYYDLKHKNKGILKSILGEDFELIWTNRKALKKMIKKLRKKYPELKQIA